MEGARSPKTSQLHSLGLTKGLKFLRVVSAKESPKVMGLKVIHDSEAPQHFAGFTYCPWCRKDGQNKGTIVQSLEDSAL